MIQEILHSLYIMYHGIRPVVASVDAFVQTDRVLPPINLHFDFVDACRGMEPHLLEVGPAGLNRRVGSEMLGLILQLLHMSGEYGHQWVFRATGNRPQSLEYFLDIIAGFRNFFKGIIDMIIFQLDGIELKDTGLSPSEELEAGPTAAK